MKCQALTQPAHRDYCLIPHRTMGSAAAVTLRGRLLHAHDGCIARSLGGIFARLGRFEVAEAKRVPLTLHVARASVAERSAAATSLFVLNTHTDDEGFVDVRLVGNALAPGRYEARVETTDAPARQRLRSRLVKNRGVEETLVGHLPFVILPPHHARVAVFDLDETLICSQPSSLRGVLDMLVREPTDVQTTPAMAQLARLLAQDGILLAVSGSPEGLRADLEAILRRHGVHFLGGVALTHTETYLRGRQRPFEHKLRVLLERLGDLPAGVRVDFIGDDRKADPFVYDVVAGLIAGRWSEVQLTANLARCGLRRESRRRMARAVARAHLSKLRLGEVIILRVRSQPEAMDVTMPVRLVRDALQAAAVLVASGRLPGGAVPYVAASLRAHVGALAVRQSVIDAQTRALPGAAVLRCCLS